mmetsp:Transcript_12867/g.35530  ORF Transcript_12867/g.35530 Transcript_12867/m.35530 type:complete len:131 (-) Transcript_12867:110-502(-)
MLRNSQVCSRSSISPKNDSHLDAILGFAFLSVCKVSCARTGKLMRPKHNEQPTLMDQMFYSGQTYDRTVHVAAESVVIAFSETTAYRTQVLLHASHVATHHDLQGSHRRGSFSDSSRIRFEHGTQTMAYP